jgi:hypothetical protein
MFLAGIQELHTLLSSRSPTVTLGGMLCRSDGSRDDLFDSIKPDPKNLRAKPKIKPLHKFLCIVHRFLCNNSAEIPLISLLIALPKIKK